MNKYKTTIDFFKTKYGIGKNTIYEIYNKFGLNKRINNLVFPFEKFRRISKNIKPKPIEKELINIQKNNITFLKNIKSYRGKRHRLKLPCRGQRTKTNAKTKKI